MIQSLIWPKAHLFCLLKRIFCHQNIGAVTCMSVATNNFQGQVRTLFAALADLKGEHAS